MRGRKDQSRVSLFCLGQGRKGQQQTQHPACQTMWLRKLVVLFFLTKACARLAHSFQSNGRDYHDCL